MSDQNTPPVDSTDDLDAFSKDFFGQNDPSPVDEEPAKPSEDEASDDTDDNAPSDETETKSDSDSEAQNDDNEDDSDEAEEETPKPKKGRFQDRINELTTARREAERREAALQARLDALEKAQAEPKADPAPRSEVKAPTPEDKNDDGSEKYPLGEFDPGFIRDLTKHTIAEERAAMKAEADEQSKQSEQERAQAELNASWENKLNPARERYPDFQEKAETLVDVFSGLDQQYGDFLAQTIMSMDKGTDVLYYLANNHDIAENIVKAGATKAAIALGRIEAQLEDKSEEPQPRPKVSKAAPPPPQNKGSATVRATVSPDTDDLDAFAKEFFKKR